MPRGRPRKNPNDVLIKSAEFIGWALGGIEREILETRNRLASLTAQANQLRTRIGAKAGRPAAAGSSSAVDLPAAATAGAPKRRRRKMSPEARKRMSEMMKKRWAERRKKS
jgi:hypothetical protein